MCWANPVSLHTCTEMARATAISLPGRTVCAFQSPESDKSDSEGKQNWAAWLLLGLGTLIFLVVAGCSYRRHLHIDEVEILYSIQLCGRLARPDFMLPIELYEVALAPIARHLTSSLAFFVTFRWLFLAGLLGLCAGIAHVQQVLPSRLGRAAVFLCAVTFGPLFRHGFEARHDILVALALVVLFWACERARSGRLTFRAATLAAALVVLTHDSTLKSFAICGPALVLCALLDARGKPRPVRAFLIALARFVPGLMTGALLTVALFAGSGTLGPYLSHLRQYLNFSMRPPYHLAVFPVVAYIVSASPVHSLLTLLGLFALAARIKARRALDEALVPACFAVITLLVACLNPTLFPYNLTWMAPSLLWLTAFGLSEGQRHLSRYGTRVRSIANCAALLLGLVCLLRTLRDPYFRNSWAEQLRVINAAESLTSPNEPVVDLTGLVISRPPPSRDWLVHGFLMADYHAGKRETISQIVEKVWPAVVVGGQYRWDFVDAGDRHIVAQNYVPVSRAIWVLGSAIDEYTKRVEIHKAGRYLAIAEPTGEQLGTIDAKVVAAGNVLTLALGTHSISSLQRPWQLAWLGGARSMPNATISRPLFEGVVLPGQL
jgi:hypothetical protein